MATRSMERAPSHRARSAAVLVPLIGLFLLMPPFITVFTGPVRPWGIPLIVVYIFCVWVALVLVTALLVRRLRTAAPAQAAPGDGMDAG